MGANLTDSKGVGASLRRKEDARLLAGKGRFVGDIRFPGQLEVAFVRSPMAHALLTRVDVPEDLRSRVFTMDTMSGVKAILAKSGLEGFKVSEQPPLAKDKVRFVGEPIAMCFAETRAEAEDIAECVQVELEDLGANSDMLKAVQPGAPLIHPEWTDNIFLETFIDGDIEAIAKKAVIKVTREIDTSRQCMTPIEGKGTVAIWDRHVEQLVLYTSTQMPHIVRAGLSECLSLDQRKIRVIAPDIGGGFGWKGLLQAEEVCLAWLAMHLDRPVRWLEDRREHLVAAANCREHHYNITGYADAKGKLLAIDATAHVDAGAYSIYPFSACL
ncbi:MAG: molybdopterin-dependent oxidoreductase, partial [Alphaproteobacteria bacterium]|nr:molybdopterin-dependent oxidoreductase [Alphaproteobacteria bacterium]